MTPTAKEWYDLAVTDLGVAKHLYETYYPKPLEIICYHCQQSAEKSIKAMIMHYGAQGGMPERRCNMREKFCNGQKEL